MSKQSMPGDKTGWRRGAGSYSKSYADLSRKDNPDSKRELEPDSYDGNGYAKALPKAGKNKGGGTY